jgi:hypothetical protein
MYREEPKGFTSGCLSVMVIFTLLAAGFMAGIILSSMGW